MNIYTSNSTMTKDGTESPDSQSSSEADTDRGSWSGKVDFFLSCLGFCVGLSNVWRFPYLCYRNGGGAFLIPYFFMLFFCGIPLFLLEVAIGQFSCRGATTVWSISPLFKGAGIGTVITNTIVCIYYNVIISYTLFFFVSSFTSQLPWETCGNWWNTDACWSRFKPLSIEQDTSTPSSLFNETSSVSDEWTNSTDANLTMSEQPVNYNTSSERLPTASEEFFRNYILNISTGIDNIGGLHWQLVLALFTAWLIVFFSLIKGVKSSGKVVYFTATFPYVVLMILFIRGVLLPGAWRGIKFYITPTWSKLLTLKVWTDAATQIFYSLGPGWGVLITMSSYNKFHNNCYRDALIVPVLNCVTSVFAGFVVFSVLGFMSYETGLPVEKVAEQGAGLAFIVYPEALTQLPVSPLWAILFFFMLITLGLDSQFAMFETVTTAICDEFPSKLYDKKAWVTGAACLVMFLIGLSCVSEGGMYVLQLLDGYVALFAILCVVLVELIAIGWIYGAERLIQDMEFMIQRRITAKRWWIASWKYISPTIILVMLLMTLINHTPLTYGTYQYPHWAIGVGWCVAVAGALPIPLYMIYLLRRKKPNKPLQSFRSLFTMEFWKQYVRATPKWHPYLATHQEEYMKMMNKCAGEWMYEVEVVPQCMEEKDGKCCAEPSECRMLPEKTCV